MRRMRVWGMLLVLVVCTGIVTAQDPVDMTFSGVGNWTDPNLWDVGSVPGSELLANYVNIIDPNTVCTVNTDTGAFAGGNQRLVVDGGATLVLEEGGVLAANTWSRIGVSGEGTVIQTGGLFEVQSDKLGIGDKDGGQGYYIMSGGILTHAGDRGDLGVGSRSGAGTFTVIGTAPVIMMEELIVSERDGASGTVEFILDANGVSPIVLSNVANIDAHGDTTTSALVVKAMVAPPMEDILLVETTSDVNVAGVFDTANGGPATEGAQVVVRSGLVANTYTLTYMGGTGNDIVLLYESTVSGPVEPDTNGLVAAYRFEVDASDSSGNGYDGTLLGDAAVQDGVLVLDGDGDAVTVPPIGNSSQVTYSMWVYPTEDLEALDFSGGMNSENWSSGAIHFKMYYGVVNVGISGLSGGDLIGTTIVEPEKWSHIALTVSETEAAIYLNATVEDSRALTAPITNLVLGSASIGAWNNGGNSVGREMAGMMDDVLIYDRALSEAELLYLAGM